MGSGDMWYLRTQGYCFFVALNHFSIKRRCPIFYYVNSYVKMFTSGAAVHWHFFVFFSIPILYLRCFYCFCIPRDFFFWKRFSWGWDSCLGKSMNALFLELISENSFFGSCLYFFYCSTLARPKQEDKYAHKKIFSTVPYRGQSAPEKYVFLDLGWGTRRARKEAGTFFGGCMMQGTCWKLEALKKKKWASSRKALFFKKSIISTFEVFNESYSFLNSERQGYLRYSSEVESLTYVSLNMAFPHDQCCLELVSSKYKFPAHFFFIQAVWLFLSKPDFIYLSSGE